MRLRLWHFIPVILLTALLSSGVTYVYSELQNGNATKQGSNGQTQTGLNQDWSKLQTVLDRLDRQYVEKIDKTKLLDGAVDGMLKALEDPYTSYLSQEESKAFEENITSSFVGIGAEIQEQDGKIVVVAPIKNSPAEKAGIKPNDRILSVGDLSLEGMKASEAVTHIRGEKGTKAELTIERPGTTGQLKITIIRDTIPLETVYAEMKDGKIGLIQITKVSETTAEEFANHVKELQAQGMKGLIMDLRQNPGGLLHVAFELAEMFVPKDKLILQVEYRDGSKDVYRSKGHENKPDLNGFPMVALIDGGTASAGEILAGALRESAGIKLIGQQTFGKGTAQAVLELKDGSSVKYTNAKWLTPDGNWIHKAGIKPDIEVKLPPYAEATYVDPDATFKQDSSGTEVVSIQLMLDALGYNPGRTDGFFDDKTKAAVVAFQKAEGLEATGIVKGTTTTTLMLKLREYIRAHDVQLQEAISQLKTIVK